MNIGFDASRAYLDKKTGTENYSYQILSHLQKLDQNNKYYIYTRKNIPYPRLWTQFGLALQTFKDKLDVLFVPAHTLPLIRKPGLKTVVTVHDLGSEYLPGMHQLKQRLYLRLMQKYQLQTATKIIAVSKATKADLIKKIGISSEKIQVIYEGFDKALFKPARNASHSDAGGPTKGSPYKNYFLFVGTVQPRKNLKRLIEAVAKTDKILVIAGGKGWMSDEIYSLPKKLGIEERVKFLGYVPDQDLPALYSGAIALTFPSLFEGFGLPILEAQACGCPVLTSNISSMPEIAGKKAVYVDPYDVNDIVKGLKKVQGAKADLENIKRFSWENCAKETLQVLESV